MDPLSDVLALLKPRTTISAGLDAGGDWAIAFPVHEGVKFIAVTRGACWVSVEGEARPLRVEEGDCFLLTQQRPFKFSSDLSIEPIDSHAVYAQAENGIATCNGGGDFFLIGGRFAFAGEHASVLFGSLPAIVHVREASNQASVLRWALQQLATEVKHRQPGGFLVSEHLAHIMLVQVLRLYLAAQQGTGSGWFHALSNRQIGAVIGAVHAEPARRWTLEDLSHLAGMSRSTFAQRFKELVGHSPLEYLTRWRMWVAGDRLRNTSDTISSIALSLGYESESAFSTAFKKVMASSPSHYRREAASR